MVGVVYPGTWGGQAVFLPGDTILQVPLPAVNQTLRSHWPVELHIGNGVLPLVPHSKNRDGAAQVVTPISPQLCGGTTRQLCSWCPLAAPHSLSLAWAAAVPHSETLSPRELQVSLLQPPITTHPCSQGPETWAERRILSELQIVKSDSERRELYQFLAIKILQLWDEKWDQT